MISFFEAMNPEYKSVRYIDNSFSRTEDIDSLGLISDNGTHYNLQIHQKTQTFYLYSNDGKLIYSDNMDCNNVTSYPDVILAPCIPHYGDDMAVLAIDLSLDKPKIKVNIYTPYRNAPEDASIEEVRRTGIADFTEWAEAKGADLNDYDITYIVK